MVKTLGLTQFVIIVVVVVSLIMAWDFGRRILETVELVQAAQQADQELERVQAENETLKQLKHDVTTDSWVIKIARAELHYAQSNETLFIPAATPPPPAAPAPAAPAVEPQTDSWLQDLLKTLFGSGQ